jgi:serine/alanine racemase
MSLKQNYGGLDLFRLIAAVLVVAIHTSPLTSYGANADFFAARILSRVAVPFFFMVTGQFVVSGLLNVADDGSKWKKYLIKMSLYYGIAILIYLPVGIYAGHYQNLTAYGFLRLLVFDGTFYHLWYFPACMIGVTLLCLMSRWMRMRAMMIATGILYLFGLLGDSYFGLIQNVPVISTVYRYGFHVFSYTRNGLFFAPLFLLLGVLLGNRAITQNRKVLVIGLGGSFLMMTGEAFTLHFLGWQRHDSMYLALIPTMVFLYQLLKLWQGNSCARLRTISTWIYILHPAVIVLIHAASKFFGVSGLLVQQSLIHYLAVASASVLAAFALSLLMDRMRKSSFRCGRAWIELDRDALAQNVQLFRSMLPETCKLMPAVKAQAYGHGAALIAKELNRLGVDAFCVACVQEAAELRRHGIRGEILILGYTHPEEFPLLRRYHLIQTVIDYSYAEELNRYGKKVHVHIGVDTGMHRLGERSENIDRICTVYEMKNLIVDGMFSHLAASDRLTPRDIAFTEAQIMAWNRVIRELQQRGYTCPKLHLLGSYGMMNYPELAGDYIRVGIALYGVLSEKEDSDAWRHVLQPVLSLKARVTTIRELRTNESAGYGAAFTAEHDMRIATIAIGYADGLPRSLSAGTGSVLIHGCKAPIIGRICMDQTIVDVSGIPNVQAGDIAVLIGISGNQEISAADLAEQTHSITNEVLSRLGGRLERKTINSSLFGNLRF